MLTSDADVPYHVLKNGTNGIRQCNAKITTPLQLYRSWENDPIKICTMKL